MGQKDEPAIAPLTVRSPVPEGETALVLEVYHALVPASHITYWPE